VGAAAFFFETIRFKGVPLFRTLKFLGTPHSLYHDVVALPEYEKFFVENVVNCIWELRKEWDLAFFHDLHPESVLTPRGTRILANFLAQTPVAETVAAGRKAQR